LPYLEYLFAKVMKDIAVKGVEGWVF
jgi:hypothetical protein